MKQKNNTYKALQDVLMTYNRTGIIKEQLIAKKKAAIIKEAKETKKLEKQQIVDPFVDNSENVETQKTQQLDDVQKNFIDKFIEYSQLILLNKSNNELIKKFKKCLGSNSTAAIEELNNKTKERETKIAQIQKELNEIKGQITKETEKAKAKETLISLFNTIGATTKDASIDANPDADTCCGDQCKPSIIESKKKNKK